MQATFYDAGHILGSAITVLDVEEESRSYRLCFTGDLGRFAMPILRDPHVIEHADYLISEGTYGDRLHPSISEVKGELEKVIHHIQARRSKLVIPSFSVGTYNGSRSSISQAIGVCAAASTPM